MQVVPCWVMSTRRKQKQRARKGAYPFAITTTLRQELSDYKHNIKLIKMYCPVQCLFETMSTVSESLHTNTPHKIPTPCLFAMLPFLLVHKPSCTLTGLHLTWCVLFTNCEVFNFACKRFIYGDKAKKVHEGDNQESKKWSNFFSLKNNKFKAGCGLGFFFHTSHFIIVTITIIITITWQTD